MIDDIQRLMRKEIGPVGDTELQRDLWPSMLRKLQEGDARTTAADWALIALLALGVLFFPQAIPILLYCL